jgi:hypothetical protein
MKRTIAVFATAVVAIALAVAGVSTAATASTSLVKYNDTFTYNGAGSWTVVNGDNSTEIKNIGPTQSVLCSSNIGGASLCVDGATYTFVSNARGGVNGAQNCAYLQLDGGRSGSQDTVPGDSGKSVCADEPASVTATASVSKTPATCSSGETLTLSSVSHASFGTVAYTPSNQGDTVARTYSVTATADSGYAFASTGTNAEQFSGSLAGESTTGCTTPPPTTPTCVTNATWAYTFNSTTASGSITATSTDPSVKAGTPLCAPLYVRSTTWNYQVPTNGSNPSWPQNLDGNQDMTVTSVGTPVAYAAPDVTGKCQQHDIYATFASTGFTALAVPNVLNGPGTPYEPAFLHATLANKGTQAPDYLSGPTPTYSSDASTNCAVTAPVATLAAGVCYWDAGQQASFKTATLTFDNSASNVPVAFTVAGWSIYDRTVPAGQVVTEPIQASWTGGVGYTVTAAGKSFPVSIPAYASCPPTIQTCTTTTGQSDASLDCVSLTVDPTVHAPLCSAIDDTVTSGYITVTGVTGVTYTIHDDADGASTTSDVSVLSGNTKLPAGSYTVTASALLGYTLTSAVTQFPFTVTADPSSCDLTTLAQFTPAVNAYGPVCASGKPTSGGLQISLVDPVNYFVNGKQLTAANTPMPAGTYSVLAVAAHPGDTLDARVPNPMTVVVPGLATSCAELATLAFTGGSGPSAFLIGAAILLLLGGALIFTRKPRRPRHAA